MKKIYYLATCSICAAIIKETGISKKAFEMQDIKTEKITAKQLDEMKKVFMWVCFYIPLALFYLLLLPKAG